MSTVQDPDIVTLYREIRNNPHYLEVPNEMPFVESPLHTAASEGRTSLALEILRLKPSLGKKLNLDGLSPLHLALGNGHTNCVRRLVNHDPDLIRVPGREGITLLHYAVEKEDIDLLIYFLLICPSSINDVTVRDETVVHIAVRNENLRAFKVLLGWARKTNNMTVFPWKNEEGNTVMHLAALTDQSQVMKSLIKDVHVNKKNLEGKTALDILKPENVEGRKILKSAGAKEGSSLVNDDTRCEKYLKSNGTMEDFLMNIGAYLEFGLSGDMRNAILVAVVLVATATFQAILTPPLGISHNDTNPVFPTVKSVHNDTNSTSTIFPKIPPLMAKVSMFCNAFAFGVAMGTCLILLDDRIQLFPMLSLLLLLLSYVALTFGIDPRSPSSIAVVSSFSLPLLITFPWKFRRFKMLTRGDDYHKYNLEEVKYFIYGSIHGRIKNPYRI